MRALVFATLALLVVLIVGVAAGAPQCRKPARHLCNHVLGAIGGAALAVGAALWLARGRASAAAPRPLGGGAEEPTALFHGESVPEGLVPLLEGITAAPGRDHRRARVPKTAAELELAPPYQAVHLKVNPVLSYGQRKLLIAEVGFLTRFGHLSREVVYAGAAPGVHIPLLAHLFPEHRFTLYDSGRFLFFGYPETWPRITRVERYFGNADAERLAERGVLFISDIRTGATDAEAGARAPADMRRQKAWVELLRPAAASLKFRLAWSGGTTQYFGGTLRLQAWAPKSTNETRLEFVGVPPAEGWDNEGYDRKLHFLNEGLRQWAFFAGALPSVPGVDHCFDCALEIATWEAYRVAGLPRRKLTVAALMGMASRALRQRLDVPPHGVRPETPMAEKREAFVAECKAGAFSCHPQARAKKRRRAAHNKRRARRSGETAAR
jgi:hypothetical protein